MALRRNPRNLLMRAAGGKTPRGETHAGPIGALGGQQARLTPQRDQRRIVPLKTERVFATIQKPRLPHARRVSSPQRRGSETSARPPCLPGNPPAPTARKRVRRSADTALGAKSRRPA